MNTSGRARAAASTRMRICPGPGWGTGASVNSSASLGSPCLYTCHACMRSSIVCAHAVTQADREGGLMLVIDPNKTWAKVEERLANETDPLLRRNLSIVLEHMKAEA